MNSSPDPEFVPEHLHCSLREQEKITKRNHLAGQALANAAICTGVAAEYELRAWFGDRCGITRYEIAAKQAMEYADAMLKAFDTPTGGN
jgi:hypothetical protein